MAGQGPEAPLVRGVYRRAPRRPMYERVFARRVGCGAPPGNIVAPHRSGCRQAVQIGEGIIAQDQDAPADAPYLQAASPDFLLYLSATEAIGCRKLFDVKREPFVK